MNSFIFFSLLVQLLGTISVCIVWCISLFCMLPYVDVICLSMKKWLRVVLIFSLNFNIHLMSIIQFSGQGSVSNNISSNPYKICRIHSLSFPTQPTDNPFHPSWWPFFSLSHFGQNFCFYLIPTIFNTIWIQKVCTCSLIIFHAIYQ